MKKLFNLKRGSMDVGQSRGTDTPEFNAPRGVRQFCESDSAQAGGEEVTHLPIIVEACESSPAAAGAAAYQIRKFLSKDNYNRPAVQYNAIMLIGILSNNPGPSFTKNIDSKFITAIKELLKNSQDPSVQQMMRETMANLERDKSHDTNLKDLLAMWAKEKDTPLPQNTYVHRHPNNPAGGGAYGRGIPVPGPSRQPGLPPPHELVGRIEEAKSSASLLIQLLQSTPPAEFASNELIKEFAGRCTSAQKSIQQYMNATDPSPDEQTFKTLIETSEQLSLAQARHQRAKLAAYKYANPSPQPQAPGQGDPLAAAGAAQTQGQPGQVPTIVAPQPQRAQPTMLPSNGALVDTSVPPTMTNTSYSTMGFPPGAGATGAAGGGGADPFGDENRIPDPQAQYQQNSTNNNRYSQASFEMPTNTTAQHPAFKSPETAASTTDQLQYAPPSGPPPGKGGAPVLPPVGGTAGSGQLVDDADDMYSVSPASVRKPGLNGTGETAPQEQASSFADSQGRSYGDGLPYTSGEARGLGNVRDDEAGAAPSAGSGWRSYQ